MICALIAVSNIIVPSGFDDDGDVELNEDTSLKLIGNNFFRDVQFTIKKI